MRFVQQGSAKYYRRTPGAHPVLSSNPSVLAGHVGFPLSTSNKELYGSGNEWQRALEERNSLAENINFQLTRKLLK